MGSLFLFFVFLTNFVKYTTQGHFFLVAVSQLSGYLNNSSLPTGSVVPALLIRLRTL